MSSEHVLPVRVLDVNDNYPRLVETQAFICAGKPEPIIITAKDEDSAPFSQPFTFTLPKKSPNWDLKNVDGVLTSDLLQTWDWRKRNVAKTELRSVQGKKLRWLETKSLLWRISGSEIQSGGVMEWRRCCVTEASEVWITSVCPLVHCLIVVVEAHFLFLLQLLIPFSPIHSLPHLPHSLCCLLPVFARIEFSFQWYLWNSYCFFFFSYYLGYLSRTFFQIKF